MQKILIITHTRSGNTMKMAVLDKPTCVCDGGVKGSLNGRPFHKDCLDEPKGAH